MSDCYSCPQIAGHSLNFEGPVDEDGCIALCCEKHIPNHPAMGFAGTAEETLERFLGMRALAAAECRDNTENPRYGCRQCAYLRKADWHFAPRICYVNLSMYPAPCQSKCLYCCEAGHLNRSFTPEVDHAYEKLFDFLEYADQRGMIDPKATWQVSSGEITLHPYKDRIMELVRDRHAVFYTNAFLFDEAIAQKLHDDPDSAIDLSIDAGTPETWRKVKGIDNFETVLSNLHRYRRNCAGPGQIILKYIILPDVNDGPEDLSAAVEIAKRLDVRCLTIARDTEKKYSSDNEYRSKLLEAAARLLVLGCSNGMMIDMYTYSLEERAEAVKLAKKLLEEAGGKSSGSPAGHDLAYNRTSSGPKTSSASSRIT